MTFPDTHTPELSLRPDTVTVQAGRPARTPGAPVNTPITLSAKYIHDSDRPYGRDGNEGWDALETALGALEGGHAISFASGMAAIAAVAELVPVGGVVVLPTTAYHGVSHWFGRLAERARHRRTADPSDTAAVLEAADSADLGGSSRSRPHHGGRGHPTIAAGAREGRADRGRCDLATPLRRRPLSSARISWCTRPPSSRRPLDLLLGVIAATQEYARSIAGYRHDAGSIPAVDLSLACKAAPWPCAWTEPGERARAGASSPASVGRRCTTRTARDSEHSDARGLPARGVILRDHRHGEQTEQVLAGLHLFSRHQPRRRGELVERRAPGRAMPPRGLPRCAGCRWGSKRRGPLDGSGRRYRVSPVPRAPDHPAAWHRQPTRPGAPCGRRGRSPCRANRRPGHA